MADVFNALCCDRPEIQWTSIDMAEYRRFCQENKNSNQSSVEISRKNASGFSLPESLIDGDTSTSVSQFAMAGMGFPSDDTLLQASSDSFQMFPDSSVPSILDFPASCPQSFAYYLLAQTSPLTLQTEEPVSLLNQDHLYKIIFQSSSLYPNNLLESVIRLTFQDRSLECMEQVKVSEWHQAHPNDRMIEIDKPQCDNVINVLHDPRELNVVSVVWNSPKPPTLAFRLNCVGSEFTSRKNGGQRGVAFKLAIVTSFLPNSRDVLPEIVDCASTLVKVFKSSGAERKVSLEREKLEMLNEDKKRLYRQSANCTKFMEIPVNVFLERQQQQKTVSLNNWASSLRLPHDNCSSGQLFTSWPSPTPSPAKKFWPQSNPVPTNQVKHSSLLINPLSTCQEVVCWLQCNGFESFVADLQKFSGTDLLRLSREDLIRISKNTAEAIRLNNILHLKKLRPRLCIYVRHRFSLVGLKGSSRSSEGMSSTSNSSSPSSLHSSRSSSSLSIFDGESSFDMTELPWPLGFESSSTITSCQKMAVKRRNHDDCYEGKTCAKRHCAAGQTCDNEILVDHEKVYWSVYLDSLTVRHLVDRLCALCKVSVENVVDVYIMNIHENLVYVTDSDVEKLEDEASFTLHVQQDSGKVDRCIFILETTVHPQLRQLQPSSPASLTLGF